MRLRHLPWFSCFVSVACQVVYVTGPDGANLQALLDAIEALQVPLKTTELSHTTSQTKSVATQVHAVRTGAGDGIFTLVTGANGGLEIAGLTIEHGGSTMSSDSAFPLTTTHEAASTTSSHIATSTQVLPTQIPSAKIAAAAVAATSSSVQITKPTTTITSTTTVVVTIPVFRPTTQSSRATITSLSTIYLTTIVTVHTPTILQSSHEAIESPRSADQSSVSSSMTMAKSSAPSQVVVPMPGATYVPLVPSGSPNANDTITTSKQRSTVVKTAASIGGILGAGIISGLVVLGLMRRRPIKSEGQADYGSRDVYGNSIPRNGGKGGTGLMRWLRQGASRSRARTMTPDIISRPRLVSSMHLDLSRMHSRLDEQESRLARQKRQTSLYLRPTSLISSRSSRYASDQKLPIRLGSPREAGRPVSNGTSYRVPSWRYQDPDSLRLGTEAHKVDERTVAGERQRSMIGQMSHFSLVSDYSEFGPYMSRHIPSKTMPASLAESKTKGSRNFSRPASSPASRHGVSIVSRSEQKTHRHECQEILPAKIWTLSDTNEIEAKDGHRTQVYKLLKRALGK